MKDRIFSIVLLLFCLIMYLQAEKFSGESSFQVVDTGVYPRAIIIIIALLALLLFISSFGKRNGEQKVSFDKRKFWTKYGKSILLFLFVGIYIILLPILHFIIATLAFMFFSQALLMGIRRRKAIIINCIVSCVSTFGVYFIFINFLNVILP